MHKPMAAKKHDSSEIKILPHKKEDGNLQLKDINRNKSITCVPYCKLQLLSTNRNMLNFKIHT